MSASVINFIVGMSLLFAGQRLFAGTDTIASGLSLAGLVALIAALALRVRERASAPTDVARDAHTQAMVGLIVSLASLALYALSTEDIASKLTSDEESLKRITVSLQAIFPIVWLLGAIPMILVDRAIVDNPRVVQPLRIRQAVDNGLAVALGLALVFPVNYLAKEYNKRWDLAYFKTTTPGESTRAIVEHLAEPLVVRVFLPTSSDVAPELMGYFEQLKGPNLDVQLVDHAAEPALAKELKIRDNGYVAVTAKDGTEDANTKSWKVGTELDDAKRNLKKLDEEFRKRLLEMAKGKRTVYFTVGHGELGWKGGERPEDKITGLKKGLELMNLKVKELGLVEGLGNAVPDDASFVVIMGPKQPFLDAEIATLKAYVERGGSLWIAVEPDGEPLDGLLLGLGLKRGAGTLASEVGIAPIAGDISDRVNVATNRYSSHESTTTLAKAAKQIPLITPTSAWFEELSGGPGKTTVVVRSMDTTWPDLDGDLKPGAGEEKKSRPVAAAVSLPVAGEAPAEGEQAKEGRALVIGDATVLSDLVLSANPTRGHPGSVAYLLDGTAWLMNEEELGGTVENEEDVKIEHSREDQVKWFYGTIAGVPLLVFVLGALRVRSRRSGGAA